MSPRGLLTSVTLAALLVALAACGGDGSSPIAIPTRSPDVIPPFPHVEPTPEPTPKPKPAVETLAFIRDGDIWLIGADGGNQRPLNLSNVRSFSWISLDELYVVVSGDPHGHLLIDLEGDVFELPFPTGGSWSRDGSLYVVPVDQQLVVFERDGGEIVRLEVGPEAEECPPPPASYPPPIPDRLSFGQPVFSPDSQGVLLAVHCYFMSGAYNFFGSIYEVSLDGAVNRPLQERETEPQVNLRGLTGPRPSPDGRRIAWASVGGFSLCPWGRGLTVADADGANSRGLSVAALTEVYEREPRPDTIGGISGYDWSPESDTVVAGLQVYLCSLDVPPPVEPIVAGLYILKPDGSAEEQLDDGEIHSPVWSPSGRFIAYVTGNFFGEPTEQPTIRLLDLTTRQVVDLAQGSQPTWQPQP